MVKLLKYSYLLVGFLISGFLVIGYSQDSPTIFLEGKTMTSAGKKISGSTITIKKNGSTINTVSSSSSGKYGGIELPMGFVYTITASCDGYLSKTITIDGKAGYYEEDSPLQIPLEIPFELDEKKPDVDYSPVSGDFQVGKLSIDPATGGLALDVSYTNSQKSKYKKFFEDLEKAANAEEEKFKKLIENGDKAFQAGNYSEALNNYQQAQQIKQDDPGVGGKITTTEQKIEQKKSFDKTVSEGDNALSAKNFDQAIAKYEQAKSIMPEDKTIDAKIKAAQDQKAAAEGAEIDAKFKAKMTEANKAFADKDYAYAKTLYQEAGTIKPSEKEPPIKIKECDDIIKEQLAKEKEFNELVAAGDKGMLDEAYDLAIDKYTAALNIKDDSRVKSELEKAKQLKKKKEEDEANAAKKAEFDKFIADGDGKLSSEDFDGAISKYNEALKMNFDNATANAKIKEAEAAKKAKEDKDAAEAAKAQFDKLIADGDSKLGSEDFDGAISKYKEALNLGVDNAKANAKIKEAEDAKKAKEDKDAEAAAKAQFDKLIVDGDGKLGSEDFDGAISKYKEALNLGVDNAKANAKIKEAEDAKKAKEDKDAEAAAKAQFDKLIADGDGKLGSEDFDGAISKYKEALDLGVDNTKANAKIKEAEDAKKAKEDKDAAAAAKDKFNELIADGDGKLGSEDFDGAISKYKEALDLGVDNAKANAKIKEAEDAKKAKQKEDADAAAQAEFDKLIADGDSKLGSEDFDGAIKDYQKALATGVDDPKANAKIKAAEKLRDEKAAADQKAADKAKFDELIASGDDKLGSEDFVGAIMDYQNALKLGVDDPKATAKIKEAEKLRDAKNDAAASAAKFAQLIADGDSKLGSEDFNGAIKDYQKALAMGVDDPLANEKIKEAERLRDEKEAADNAAAEKAKFDKLIASGDDKLGNEDFVGAILDYQNALKLGVDDPLATSKIKEAEKLRDAKNDAAASAAQFDEFISSGDDKLGGEDFDGAIKDYQKALAIGVNDPLANEKIKNAEKLRDQKEAAEDAAAEKKKFDELIASGDDKLNSEDFTAAIVDYQNALKLGVDDPTATARIKKAEKLRDDKLAAQGEAEKQAKFDKYISSGDGHLSAEAFDMAINEYQSALDLNVNNTLANQKLKEAKDAKSAYDKKMAADAEANAREKEFNDLIAKGDAAKNAKSWDEAKGLYSQANEVKPESDIPEEKISEVNRLMKEELEDEQDVQFQKYLDKGKEITEAGEYEKAIGLYTKAKGLFAGKEDILNAKIAEVTAMKEKEDQYNKYMSSADGLFEAGKWKEARVDYDKARKVFDRPRPSEQIAIIDQKLADEAAANDEAANLAKKKAEYEALMKQAKSQREGKKYQEAIATYKEAQSVMPKELEPQKRIDEINALLAEMASNNALMEKYQAAIAKADAKRDEAMAAKSQDLAQQAKDLYNEANKIKSDESYPQQEVNKLSNLMAQWKSSDDDLQYQKIIDKADELFERKLWDGAEKLYNRAIDLGLKPGDPYPPAQLEKIKKAREAEANVGNTAVVTPVTNTQVKVEKEPIEIKPPDYGTEVSMSEEEIEKLWADARVDEVTDKDEAYVKYKEDKIDEHESEISHHTGRSNSVNESYDEMEEDIADKNEYWDEQRKDILPEMVELKERESDKLNNFSGDERDRTYDLDNYYNDSETERSEYEIGLDVKREDVIADMEQYKFERSEDNLDLAKEERDVTYNNNEYYEEREVEVQDEHILNDEPRQDNVNEMIDYSEIQSDLQNDLTDRGVNSTYETHGHYREMADEFEKFTVDGDERRREETVADMDDYKEIQEDILLANNEEGIDKTDGVNQYNVSYHDYLDDFADQMDIPREDNVTAMEVYQNDKSDNHRTDIFQNEVRSQENYQDKDDVKEAQAAMFDEESTMVEANMENVQTYKDKKSDMDAAMNQEFSDVGYNNSVTMDSVKAQKSTMFSDEFMDPLANQYPEGITEKTFQRTNNLGEVVEITIVRIVVRGNKADEYRKVTSKWNTAYFKNGGIINEYIWDTETN